MPSAARSERMVRGVKRILCGAAALLIALCLAACAAESAVSAPEKTSETPAAEQTPAEREPQPEREETAEEEKAMLQMKIGETAVMVEWEENASVQALEELCRKEALVIPMSMYGGFEQVGPIGTSLPHSDSQTTTAAGDLVLYSGNQLVVFYGSNSWAYTRLGHITDQSAEDMASLLGRGDVTITITWGSAE